MHNSYTWSLRAIGAPNSTSRLPPCCCCVAARISRWPQGMLRILGSDTSTLLVNSASLDHDPCTQNTGARLSSRPKMPARGREKLASKKNWMLLLVIGIKGSTGEVCLIADCGHKQTKARRSVLGPRRREVEVSVNEDHIQKSDCED